MTADVQYIFHYQIDCVCYQHFETLFHFLQTTEVYSA